MSQCDGLIDRSDRDGAAHCMRPAVTIVIGMPAMLIIMPRRVLSHLMINVRNARRNIHIMGAQLDRLVSNQGEQSQNAEPDDTHTDETFRQVVILD